MAGVLLFLLVLLFGGGDVGAKPLDPILKLRFVSPALTVSVCGQDYDISSTCMPMPFYEDEGPSVYPDPEDPVYTSISADILRSQPEVVIEEDGSPWAYGPYCILMAEVVGDANIQDIEEQLYVHWFVCDIPGNDIEKGRELLPYEYNPQADADFIIWLFRVITPGQDYDMDSLTTTCSRCGFDVNRFIDEYDVERLYSPDSNPGFRIYTSPGIWSTKQLLDNGLKTDRDAACDLITSIATTSRENVREGYQEFCSRLGACSDSTGSSSGRRKQSNGPHPALSWPGGLYCKLWKC